MYEVWHRFASVAELLKTLIRFAAILSAADWRRSGDDSSDVYNEVMNVVEKELLLQVLRQSQGVQTRTATRLGINRNTLHKKIEDHNLSSEAR